MLNGIKRFAHRLGIARRRAAADPPATEPATFATEFDATWHGDHWQNLLASPLDARHYVMEDWTLPALPASAEAEIPLQPKRRRRWYEQ